MSATLPLAIAIFAVGVDAYIVAATLPAIADDLREPIAAVGILASSYALPAAVFAPVFGPLSDRRGRRRAMLLGLAMFCLGTMASILAPTLPVLVAARVASGLGAAIIVPVAFAFAGDMPSPGERARTMAHVSSMFPFSTLLGLPIGAAAGMLAGWRASFVFFLVIGLAALVLVARLAPRAPTRPTPAGAYLDTYRVLTRHPESLPILLVTYVWFSATFGSFVYLGEFIHAEFGVPASSAGLVYVAVGVTGLIGTRVAGPLIERLGPRRLCLSGISLFLLSALVLPLTRGSLPLAILVFSVWAFGTWSALPALNTLVAAISQTARGTLLAFNSSVQNLAFVVSPLLIGAVLAAGGFDASFRVSAAIAAVALALAWIVLPRSITPGPLAAEAGG